MMLTLTVAVLAHRRSICVAPYLVEQVRSLPNR